MSDSQGVLDFMIASDWTAAEQAVWRVLRGHAGREKAIKAELVAELADMNVRNVQRAIHSLIHHRAKAIGSSMSEPMGYFLAATSEERRDAAKLHKDRALAMLTTASKIMAIDRRELLAQIQTELDAA